MNKYKAVKVNGIKRDLHRLLMEERLGRKLDRTEVVHHINGDPSDNRLENLQVMSLSEHAHLHQAGRIEPEWVRKARSERLKGRPNMRDRRLTKDDVIYIREHYKPSDNEFGVRALAKKFGVSHPTISKIINDKTYVNF